MFFNPCPTINLLFWHINKINNAWKHITLCNLGAQTDEGVIFGQTIWYTHYPQINEKGSMCVCFCVWRMNLCVCARVCEISSLALIVNVYKLTFVKSFKKVLYGYRWDNVVA